MYKLNKVPMGMNKVLFITEMLESKAKLYKMRIV